MNSTLKQRINTLAYDTPPNGYHKSKLGLMPDDWNICTLGSITSRISDKNGDNTTYPAYSINNQIGFIPQSEQFEEGSYGDLNKSSYKIVERGQFAYNPARINVGSIGVLKDCEKAIVSSLYVCFSVSDKVDQNYLENWFRTFDFFKEIIRNTEGSVREYLFYENFANIRMRLPPLAEQKKIAEILGCCDELIRLKKELIAEKKKQKKALMQKLLDPNSGFRLPGFAEKWIHDKLGNIAPLQRGFDLPQSLITDGKFPVVYSNGIANHHSSYMVNGPGVVTGRSGTIGSVIYVEKSFWPHNTTLWVTNFHDNCPKFIYYLYAGLNFSRYASGSGVPTLNRNDLHQTIVAIPHEHNEQQEIATVLSISDHEIDLLEQELAQQERKKKSLMQLLLTGIVRVLA